MAQKPARSPASRWGGSAGEEEGGRLATWMADAMSRGGGVVPEKILESWRWRSVYVALFAPPSLPSFRCPIWNGASSFQSGRHAACQPFGLAVQAMTCLTCLACTTQPLVFDRATGDTGQQAARVQSQPGGQIPLPLPTLPFAVRYFYFYFYLFLFHLGVPIGCCPVPSSFPAL